MLTPQEQAWLDQEDAHVVRIIRKHGWYVQAVLADPRCGNPSFAYSVGLWGMGHPELVVVGLAPHTMHWMINEVGERIRAGADLLPGEIVAVGSDGLRVTVEELPNPAEILYGANRHYLRPPEYSVDAFQLTWCDESGRFPGDPGCDIPADIQPRPGDWRA